MVEDEKSIYLIQEYVSGGELFDYIIEQERYSIQVYRLTDGEAKHIMRQLINAIDYLHKLGIIHRDLKPENILMRENGDICLIDFGLSMEIESGQLLVTPCGSPCYAAPEMLEGRNYDGNKTDIWSCGIIMYAMLCGYLPFDEENTSDLYDKIKACKYVIPRSLTPDARDLMSKILLFEEKRITIQEIKQHPWFQEFEDDQPQEEDFEQDEQEEQQEYEQAQEQEQEQEQEVSIEQIEPQTRLESDLISSIESQHSIVEPVVTIQNRPRGHTLKRESIMSELEVNVFQPQFKLPISNERKNLQTIEQAYQIIQESSRQREKKVIEELQKSKVQITSKPAMKINSNRPFVKKVTQQHVRYRN